MGSDLFDSPGRFDIFDSARNFIFNSTDSSFQSFLMRAKQIQASSREFVCSYTLMANPLPVFVPLIQF